MEKWQRQRRHLALQVHRKPPLDNPLSRHVGDTKPSRGASHLEQTIVVDSIELLQPRVR